MSYFRPRLRVKLHLRLRSPELIDDVCQETFLRVLQSIARGDLRQAGSLGAYVNSVCNNVLREYHRDQARLAHVDVDSVDPRSQRPDPEHNLLQEERIKIVNEVIAEMSPKDRSFLRTLLNNADDKPPDKALAAQHELPVQHFRVAAQRAKKRFVRKLQKMKGLRAGTR